MRTIIDDSLWYGGEAILRDSGGLCNLTEVVIRPTDTFVELAEKVRKAAILGTLQSTLTSFRYLRKVWRDNAEEERLLGISLTGIMDHPIMSGDIEEEIDSNGNRQPLVIRWLKELKQVARETNNEWASILGINPSKQLTLIKPSGTVSQLVNSSSGIHPRYARFYIRRVIQDNKDRLTNFMKDQGIPHVSSGDKTIFSFVVKSPENCITTRDMGAMEQLKLWKIYREHWCDGNPSQTIYYNDDEYFAIAQWVWDNWDSIGGLSFFPRVESDTVYENAPYEEIDEEEYEKLSSAFPNIDWSKLKEYEKQDETTSSQEFACIGGACEV